jgi:hypothetical protein
MTDIRGKPITVGAKARVLADTINAGKIGVVRKITVGGGMDGLRCVYVCEDSDDPGWSAWLRGGEVEIIQ